MNAQDVILGSRILHLREMKAALAAEKAANARLRDENAALRAGIGLAALALSDLREMGEGERLEVWDGWNLVLGAGRAAKDRNGLKALAQARIAEDARLRIWIVFDGEREAASNSGRLRVSYTGGVGEQRADRFILSFVRAAAYLGLAGRLSVRTDDKRLMREATRLVGISER